MANVYLEGMKAMGKGTINWEGGAIKALLLKVAGFTETDATVAAILAGAADEFTADSGYSRQTLGSAAVTVASGKTKFSSSNVAFSSIDSGASISAVAMVIYYDPGGGDAACIPLVYSDGADEAFTDNNLKTLTYNCPSDGWFYMANA